jgi:hypothetical protein
MGTNRIGDAATQSWRIAAHSGFNQASLDDFAAVRDAEDSCGQTFERRQRTIIDDGRTSPAPAVMETG